MAAEQARARAARRASGSVGRGRFGQRQPRPRLALRAQLRVGGVHHPLQRVGPVRGGEVERRLALGLDPRGQGGVPGARAQPLGGPDVQHLEAGIQAGRQRVRAQQAGAERVDGADPGGLRLAREVARAGAEQAAADPLAQLAGGLVGERQRQDLADLDAVVQHRLDEPLGHHRRLARAGVRRQQPRPLAGADRLALLAGQRRALAHRRHCSAPRQMPGYWQPFGPQVSGRAAIRPACRSAATRSASSRAATSAAVERAVVDEVLDDVVRGGERARVGAVADQPASARVLGADRLVDAGQRPQAEQALDREQVELHLQLALLLPDGAAIDRVALVVAHDRVAAGGIDVDPVDAARDAHAGQLERRRGAFAVAPEAPLQLRRLQPRARLRLVRQQRVQARLQPPQHHPCGGAAAGGRKLLQRRRQRLARGRQRVGRQPRRARALAQQRQRPLQHAVGERSALQRLGVGIDRLGRQQLLDQPAHAAAGERLQPARRLAVAGGQQRQHGGRARRRQRARLAGRAGGGERPLELARRRRRGGREGDVGEQPPAAAAPQLVAVELAHVVDERRGLQRLALLVAGAEGEHQPVGRPRRAGVEEEALLVDAGLARRQHEPGRARQVAPVGVVEERVGRRRPWERPLLQAGDDHYAEAPRADRKRIGDQHAVLGARRLRRHAQRPDRGQQVGQIAQRGGIDPRQLAQLAERAPDPGRQPRVRVPVRAEHLAAAMVRRHPGGGQLRFERAQEGARPARRSFAIRVGVADAVAAGGSGDPVELGKRRLAERRLPHAAGGGGALQLATADAALQRVCRLGRRQAAGRAQPPQHVGGAAARERGARERQQSGAERCRLQRDGAARGDGHVQAAQDVAERRPLAVAGTQHDRDLGRCDARRQQPLDLGAGQLRLGPLAAGLEQPHRAAGVGPAWRVLEQAAFEVRERGLRRGRVVGVGRRQLDVLGGLLAQPLDEPRAGGERGPLGLVGERHDHRGADRPGQRLDRVHLQRRQIVPAVQGDGPLAPPRRLLAQCCEHRPAVLLGVGPAERPQPRLVRRGTGPPARGRTPPGRRRRRPMPSSRRRTARASRAPGGGRRTAPRAPPRTPAPPPTPPAAPGAPGAPRPRSPARAPAGRSAAPPRRPRAPHRGSTRRTSPPPAPAPARSRPARAGSASHRPRSAPPARGRHRARHAAARTPRRPWRRSRDR